MIYALYHAPTETAGLLGDITKEFGLPFKDVHLYDGEGLPRDTSDLEGLIVMGGPMSVNDTVEYPFLLSEVLLIEKLLSEKKPVIGICLGAQLIAKALGSRVYPNKEKEIGWHPIQLTSSAAKDPLFRAAPQNLHVLHWHGETFDLPKGAVHLARSLRCENQAFRWEENTYGLQFHLEATPAMLQDWCSSDQGSADLDAAGEDGAEVLRQTPQAYEQLEPVARQVFSTYLKSAFHRLLPVA